MQMPVKDNDELTYHLRRSFTDGDQNYDARVLYARQLFIDSQFEEARKIFDYLRRLSLSPSIRNRLVYPVGGKSEGRIVRLEPSYCFIARDGAGDWIYTHRSNVAEHTWKNLTYGARLRFEIAFSVMGPGAFNIELLGPEAEDKQPQLPLFDGGAK
jgi:cold shock CspA family protein